MIGGRGVRLAPTSGVLEGELFVCIDVDAGQTESLVRLASRVEHDWLPADQLVQTVDVAFDPKSERVTARRRVRIEDLVLENREAPLPEGDDVAHALAAVALERLDAIFPADDTPTGRFLARLRCLGDWMPDLQLPRFVDEDMRTLLVEL